MVKSQRQVRGERGCAAKAVAACALGCASLMPIHAADLYASNGLDGSPRYATQALDSSYHLIARELPSAATDHPPEARDARRRDLHAIIARLAGRHDVSPALVEAIVAVESNGDPFARSANGAQGLMQLMPGTAARYGLKDPERLRDPERNLEAGIAHLKDLLSQHHGNVALALAAYNAGAGAVAQHHQRIPPYRETMLYVPAVLAKSAALAP
jgi:soluble lytic murein transglycosylase-like protein